MMKTNKMVCSLVIVGAVLLLLLAACDSPKNKTYTVGVINIVPDLDQVLDGFKDGMSELGYVEGKNIRYIYDGPTTDMGKLQEAAHTLVATNVDMILSITNPATLAAKQATGNIELPVVFSIVIDPAGEGIVNRLKYPGGNITGVAFEVVEARRLDWLVKIAPSIKQIYIPFNPNDGSSVSALKMVRNTAKKLDVELILREVDTPEALDDAIMSIPGQADAVFLLPDALVSTKMADLVNASNNLNLPTSGANISVVKDYSVLTSFGIDLYLTGKQTARLADQVFKGIAPEDLPVEISEVYLAINLETAKTIRLKITDGILRQTDIIAR